MTRIGSRHALVALVAAIVAAAASVAEAASSAPARRAAVSGSIVFTKGGNVWTAAPDGSRQRRVTKNGTASNPYSSPTQANNGTIVALRDSKIYRLNRRGRALRRPFAVASGLRNAGSLHDLAIGPAVSPDGKKVALTLATLQGTYNSRTGASGMNLLSVTTVYRNAVSGAKLAERHEPGTYLQSPSWIDNSRLLVFAPYSSYSPQVYVDALGGGLRGWFADELEGDSAFDRKLLDEGELSRGADKLALIRGTNVDGDWTGAALTLYAVAGFSSAPRAVCTLRATHGPLAKPTWSPDGSSLAWSDTAGVWTSRVDLGSPGCGLSPRLVVRRGSTPDWGPAAAR
jgi:WD40-like Beta Propeller Repeat